MSKLVSLALALERVQQISLVFHERPDLLIERLNECLYVLMLSHGSELDVLVISDLVGIRVAEVLPTVSFFDHGRVRKTAASSSHGNLRLRANHELRMTVVVTCAADLASLSCGCNHGLIHLSVRL